MNSTYAAAGNQRKQVSPLVQYRKSTQIYILNYLGVPLWYDKKKYKWKHNYGLPVV